MQIKLLIIITVANTSTTYKYENITKKQRSRLLKYKKTCTHLKMAK
jgi:hypothetical protein